jgi:hypothetical protein
MDYAESLRAELTKAHAVFQAVLMDIPNYSTLNTLLFFEGDDDPSFYFPHIRAQDNSKDYITFICNGRIEVLKTLELIESDGRAYKRSLFFIDKDHNDIIGVNKLNARLYQTKYYSIENYLVCLNIVNSYWVETLHLQTLDTRKAELIDCFNQTYNSFNKKMTTLMALVLLGRGCCSSIPARKLNLNNANLDLIFDVDFEKKTCKYLTGAGKHFADSTNVTDYGSATKLADIKAIIAKHLMERVSKEYIRGKYELWFFVKYLQFITKKLSSKAEAKVSKLKRATPKISISHETAIENLGSKVNCPEDLKIFLHTMLTKIEPT